MQAALSFYSFQWRSMFASAMFRYVCDRFPRKLKRLMYMSSILGLIMESQQPDMILVEKINTILRLAKDPAAYRWSIQVNSLIWSAISPVELDGKHIAINRRTILAIDSEDCWRVGEHLSRNAPAWVRYGSDDLMTQDAIAVIHHLRNHIETDPSWSPAASK